MKLPVPQDPMMRETVRILERMDSQNRKTNQDIEMAGNRIILTSPNGTRYALVVDNAGTLSTVAI